jgi:ATP-dependent Clp protease ATP-binding subunit ClpC
MNPGDATATIDLSSMRAYKARAAYLFHEKWFRIFVRVAAITCFGVWVATVFMGQNALGYLFLGLAGLLATPLLWYYGELEKLAPADTGRIDSVLDRSVLAQLHSATTSRDLVAILSKQPGMYFFASRFSITREMLDAMADYVPIETIWTRALSIQHQLELETIDSSVLVAAICLSVPNADAVLGRLELDSEDILTGVKWFAHIQETIAVHTERKNYGGIGRDLSFGWAPTLNRVGYNITRGIESGAFVHRSLAAHDEVIAHALHTLGQQGRRNAVLVGEAGVGKTTIVHSLAKHILDAKSNAPGPVQYNQVISLDAAHLISVAKGQGELEGLVAHLFGEAIAAKNIIIFLDEAQLFLQDGTGSVDLSNILLPVLEGGALKIILSLDDQHWLRISQTNPGLTQLMNRVIVKPLDEHDTMQVLEDGVLLLETKHHVVYMRQALQEAYKLANRFIHEQAMPGKAIRLLEAAAGFAESQHFITARSVQQAVEKSFDVRVQSANTAEERNVLLNLEEKIHERMINQTRAVKLVSDALRRARAGVRNESKPIGTFLFLGPTGVGKTELTKALAAVYFGGEDRMVRVDLNEYSRPDDTNRLLAIGATDPYSLCAQIAKQPFSVVLLDEIEKAHPNVLNLLLQMLDEGTLRDAQNKSISFRDAIIIATSNAGADKIRAHIDAGQQLEQFEKQFVDELIDSQLFRPEFLNRFDEIILFRPLTPEELTQVVDLLIAGLNKRLAAQKVSVSLTPEAKLLLANTGYDPRLGARPLRRVVQRVVENLVAQKMLQGNITPGQQIQLDVPDIQPALTEQSG